DSGSRFTAVIRSGQAGQFHQANVTGSVKLDTANEGVLLVVQAITGGQQLQGGEHIVIINNDGNDLVQGNFAGLLEGATIDTNFLRTGLAATITYKGGDGNDVQINVAPNTPPVISSNGGGDTA